MRPSRNLLAILALAALLCASAPASADDVVLVLQDGQELTGVDVERTPEAYVLTLATGDKVSLPASLITEVRLSAEGSPGEDDEPNEPPTGIEVTEGKELTGAPIDGRTPRPDEQLAAFGEDNRSKFRRSTIEPIWRPSSDWNISTDVTEFNPARWYRAPIDASWTPRSAYDGTVDVFSGRRARWQRSLVDSAWWPSNGFARDEPPIEPADAEDGYRPEVRFEP